MANQGASMRTSIHPIYRGLGTRTELVRTHTLHTIKHAHPPTADHALCPCPGLRLGCARACIPTRGDGCNGLVHVGCFNAWPKGRRGVMWAKQSAKPWWDTMRYRGCLVLCLVVTFVCNERCEVGGGGVLGRRHRGEVSSLLYATPPPQ